MSYSHRSAIETFARRVSHALEGEETALCRGAMQSLDARVSLLGVLALIIATATVHHLAVISALFTIAVLLALLSAIQLKALGLRAWLPALFFTGIIALPALFLTPGPPLTQGSSITRTGLHTALLLIARVETALTLTTVLVLTIRWTQILKALRSLHVPKEAVMMLGMAHRYIFLLAETAVQMFESRESRRVGLLPAAERRRVATRSAGVLMTKSMDLSEEVFLAMQSRGYRGEVYLASEQRLRPRDLMALFAFFAFSAFCIWWGR